MLLQHAKHQLQRLQEIGWVEELLFHVIVRNQRQQQRKTVWHTDEYRSEHIPIAASRIEVQQQGDAREREPYLPREHLGAFDDTLAIKHVNRSCADEDALT